MGAFSKQIATPREFPKDEAVEEAPEKVEDKVDDISKEPKNDEASKEEDLAFSVIAGKYGASTDEIREKLEAEGCDADKVLDIRGKILRGEYFA